MVRVAAALLEHGDSYVFMLREKPPFEQRLNFIGGRLEVNETADDAIAREILEETGCEAHVEHVGSIEIDYEGFDHIGHELYVARTRTEPRTNAPDEGTIVRRAKGSVIHDPELHELHRLVIELLHDGTPFTAHARIGPAPEYALRTFEVER